MKTGPDSRPPLTVYAMAKRLGRTRISIHHHLRRHGLAPCRVDSRRSLYLAETIEILIDGIRAYHGKRRKSIAKPASA